MTLVPSLWTWQILFWLVGVPLVWWIAYRSGLGITSIEGIRVIELGPKTRPVGATTGPKWIAQSVERVAARRGGVKLRKLWQPQFVHFSIWFVFRKSPFKIWLGTKRALESSENALLK